MNLHARGTQLGLAAAERLAALGSVTIEPGFSYDDIAGVESEFGFEFVDDHRAFLAAGLPVGGQWPDWRGEGRRSLAKRVQLPVDGIVFSVEWKQFWHDGWGRRPAKIKDALRSARYQMERVPHLIPVCGHHYLPSGRGSFGHPVLSVVQAEVTVRAADLAEFVDSTAGAAAGATPTVEFWSDLVS